MFLNTILNQLNGMIYCRGIRGNVTKDSKAIYKLLDDDLYEQ